MHILGIMSGTSCDGLDCCDVNIKIDSHYNLKFDINNFSTLPFSDSEKSFLLSVRDKVNQDLRIETQITDLFIKKIEKFTSSFNFDIIACHGHTVKHIDRVISVQLLDFKLLYKKFKIPITYNFRANDILHSGTGAPLMPFLDWLLFSNIDKEIITLNIGGISNITYLSKNKKREEVIGFDTGPGMSLVDKAVNKLFGNSYDIDGIFSKKGKINYNLLNHLMKHDFIIKIPPKSTDIEEFGSILLEQIISKSKSIDSYDIIRTLIQFTVDSINYNIIKFINLKDINYELVYSGGGTDNPVVLESLMKNNLNINSISKYGIDVSIKEALLIAVLGACRKLNLYANMPSVTGASSHCILGDIYSE